MIKAIIFDNFGVLVDSVYTTLVHGLSDQTKSTILSIGEAADRGEITNDERDAQIAPFLGSGQQAIDTARHRARRNDRLLAFILELRNTYKISMLSNAGSGLVESFFVEGELEKYFDDVVLSYQVRMTKPSLEMYKLAASRLNVNLEECIFVDDSERNVVAARNAGMGGVVYKDFSQFQAELQLMLTQDQTNHA